MIKLKSLLSESKILVPRRTPEERERGLIAEHYRMIQRYIREGCRGDLSLYQSPIKVFPDNLTHVGGYLNLSDSKIEDLNNLERVDGGLYIYHCANLTSLGKLKSVDGYLDARYTSIESLENLEEVIGKLNLYNCQNLKSLGKLKFVGGSVDLDCCDKIESLGNLERVEGTIELRETNNLKSLGNLKYVGRNMCLYNSNILNVISVEKIRKQVKIHGELLHL
jgi:hypothetical protein